MAAWGRVVQQAPRAEDVAEATLRDAIVATGLPWKVKHNATGIVMVLVPPGFMRRVEYFAPAMPRAIKGVAHVTMAQPVYVATTELTVGQAALMCAQARRTVESIGLAVSEPHDNPATGVVIAGIEAVINANGLRLPTEREWVYVGSLLWREGDRALICGENIIDPSSDELIYAIQVDGVSPDEIGCDGIAGVARVASLRASGLGLHDVFGNVSELCGDESVICGDNGVRPSIRTLHGGNYSAALDECHPGRASIRTQEQSLGPLSGMRVVRDP
jgi:formylglycine-generating enzyme required for sulfatase activity